MPRKSFDPLEDPGLPETLDNGPFFIPKSQVDFGLRSSLHIKDQSRAWERPDLLL